MKQVLPPFLSHRLNPILFLWVLLNGLFAFGCIYLMDLARSFDLMGMSTQFYLALVVFTLIQIGNFMLRRRQPTLFISTILLNGMTLLLFGDITLLTFIPHAYFLLLAFF